MSSSSNIAVIIPCYKVKAHILDVLIKIPAWVEKIYVVDDLCPEKSGEYVIAQNLPRVCVIFNVQNLGVGGATKAGFQKALHDGMDIMVKIDGDDQMDPQHIPKFIQPIIKKRADYTKGNRFYDFKFLSSMPLLRLFGNTALSFINKMVSGYWGIMDPTNGYVAIHKDTLKVLNLNDISNDYFFESDLLFQLGLVRAKVEDVPLKSRYQNETSSMSILKVLTTFPGRYLKRIIKRITYQYFLRDFNLGSIGLVCFGLTFPLGFVLGVKNWIHYALVKQISAPVGSVVLPALLMIVGIQFIMIFIQVELNNVPQTPIQD